MFMSICFAVDQAHHVVLMFLDTTDLMSHLQVNFVFCCVFCLLLLSVFPLFLSSIYFPEQQAGIAPLSVAAVSLVSLFPSCPCAYMCACQVVITIIPIIIKSVWGMAVEESFLKFWQRGIAPSCTFRRSSDLNLTGSDYISICRLSVLCHTQAAATKPYMLKQKQLRLTFSDMMKHSPRIVG